MIARGSGAAVPFPGLPIPNSAVVHLESVRDNVLYQSLHRGRGRTFQWARCTPRGSVCRHSSGRTIGHKRSFGSKARNEQWASPGR